MKIENHIKQFFDYLKEINQEYSPQWDYLITINDHYKKLKIKIDHFEEQVRRARKYIPVEYRYFDGDIKDSNDDI